MIYVFLKNVCAKNVLKMKIMFNLGQSCQCSVSRCAKCDNENTFEIRVRQYMLMNNVFNHSNAALALDNALDP